MRSPIRIPIVGKTDANGNLTLPIKAQLAHHCSLNLAAKGTGTPTWEVDLDGSPELFGSGSKVVLGPMYTYPGQVITLMISAGQPNDQITGTLSGVQAETAEELQLAPGSPQVAGFTIGIVSGEFQVTDLKVTGLTGAANASRYVGATQGGAPTSGSFLQGDYIVDEALGILWICTVAGTPGTWKASGMAQLADTKLSAPSSTVVLPASGSLIAGFRNLQVLWEARCTAATPQALLLQANADGGANYDYELQDIVGNAATAPAQTLGTTSVRVGTLSASGDFSGGNFYVNAYGQTGIRRVIVANTWRNDINGTGMSLSAGNWRNTANAITSLTLFASSGNLDTNGVFTVYGLP